MSRRILKVNELLKREISKVLEEELPESWGIVTVMSCEASADLKEATCWLSFLEKEKSDKFERDLDLLASKIQKIINSRLKLKYVPRLTFKIDHSLKQALRIEELLAKIKKEKSKK